MEALRLGDSDQLPREQRPAAQAPSPQLPTAFPPVDQEAVRALVSRGDRASPSDCWAAAKQAELHVSPELRVPLDELFSPTGHPPREIGEVMRWVETEERAAADELEASFQAVRALGASLQAANLRARHAVTRSAWLYAARTAAGARDFSYLR